MNDATAVAPAWQEPPGRSPAATRLLELIERHAWKPAESTLWRRHDHAAARAGVHEWEWRNLIIHAYCAQQADAPAPRWPVRLLPHCPNVVYEPDEDRFHGTRFLQALCVCREPDTGRWPKGWDQRAHWIARHDDIGGRQDVPMYCHCGGPEEPPGSGLRGYADDGFACEQCSARLVTTPYTSSRRPAPQPGTGHTGDGPCWRRRLTCDCRCCYCGETAEKLRGWRLNCHPPIAQDADA